MITPPASLPAPGGGLLAAATVPWGLAGPALLIVAAFAAAHALGLRDNVSVVSGTAPAGGGDLAVIGGVAYVAAWLAAVVVAPILGLAAAIRSFLR